MVQQHIIQDVKDAGMYSVLADTTPDASHKDRLAIACRYVDKIGQPTERLVSFREAKNKTGEGGATEIIGSLMKQASMSGRFNGVRKKLKDISLREVFHAFHVWHGPSFKHSTSH